MPNESSTPAITNPIVIQKGGSNMLIVIISNPYSKPYPYEDLKFIMEPEAGDVTGNGIGFMSDTVSLSVFYGDTDENRAPVNDQIANAIVLPTNGEMLTTYVNKFGNTTNLTTNGATATPSEQVLTPSTNCMSGWCAEENGKPTVDHSVWFKFLAINPEIVLSLCDDVNLSSNTQMAVYKTSDINDYSKFSLIAANDKSGCTNPNSSKIFLENLPLNDTLYVLVDGLQGTAGDFSISATILPPTNDLICDRLELKVDGKTVTYSNISATINEREELLIPESTHPVTGWKADQFQHSVWYSFSAPDVGDVDIVVENATFDTQLAVYEMIICGVDYMNQWKLVAANDDPTSNGGGLNTRIELRGLERSSRYLIVVDGYKGAEGTFDLTLKETAPQNDEIYNAIALDMDVLEQGLFHNGGSFSSDEEQAIAPSYTESGKPGGWSDQIDGTSVRQIEHSVWFTFVAPAEGAVKLSACNMSDFFLQMAVYRVEDMNDYSTFNLIAAEDNSSLCRLPPSNQYPNGTSKRGSILEMLDLMPDSTYYVIIDGNKNSQGTFHLSFTTIPSGPPVNDEPCNAIPLAVNNQIQPGYTTLGATATQREYNIYPKKIWKDESVKSTVWFTFVAPATGEVEISTCDMANFDSQLAVYDVNDCSDDFGSYTLMGANEDGPKNCASNGDSFLPIKGLTSGKTYYLVVDAYGYNPGNFDIVLRDKITPGPANDHIENAILLPVDGKVQRGFNNLYATLQTNEKVLWPKKGTERNCVTGWCDDQVDNSVWFKFIAPANGKAYVSTCDLADFDTQIALYETTNIGDMNTFKLVAANDAGPDDCATFFDSYLTAENLTPGKTYYVMVDGFDADNGNFDIAVSNDGEIKTAVNSVITKEKLVVYPNPFSGTINVLFSLNNEVIKILR